MIQYHAMKIVLFTFFVTWWDIAFQEDDDFLASVPGSSDQQVLAQEQVKSSAIAPAGEVAPLEDDSEVTFDANKVTLQVPDRLFGPSFTAVNGISQAIGNVIQVIMHIHYEKSINSIIY